MATDCRTCVKYDIIEYHALGRKGSIVTDAWSLRETSYTQPDPAGPNACKHLICIYIYIASLRGS